MIKLQICTYIVFIALVAIVKINAEPELPQLPETFIADVEIELPFFGKQAGKLHYDYINLKQKVTQTQWGMTSVALDRFDHDPPSKYIIQGGTCEREDHTDELNPYTLPPKPLSKFLKYETIDGVNCQVWHADLLGLLQATWWISVTNTTDGKSEAILLRFKNVSPAGEFNMDFANVIAGPIDQSEFEYDECPQPPLHDDFIISGYVKNAVTDKVVTGATVQIGYSKGDVSATTDSNGMYQYTFKDTPPQDINITCQHEGMIPHSKIVFADGGNVAPGGIADVILSPVLPDGSFRAVLTWKVLPSDLDTHFTLGGCSVWYRHRYCSDAGTTAKLDVDKTRGFGPETLTITNVNGYNGVMEYRVRAFSSKTFSPFGAEVVIYKGSGSTQLIKMPSSGTGRWWKVFAIENGQIVVKNQIVA